MPSTRVPSELTGNDTLGRGIEQFTDGLSRVFSHFASGLKHGAPFVFTYHHNEPAAYAPLVVAILDAGLTCTAVLPAAAEMSASLHIARTNSSVVDSVFVCRKEKQECGEEDVVASIKKDLMAMRAAGVKESLGDAKCLASGHMARVAVNELREQWDSSLPVAVKLEVAKGRLMGLLEEHGVGHLLPTLVHSVKDG
jgi:adenine-specific DNA methylase